METHYYICNYCKGEFIPKRRKVQKFCSDSCRVRNHQEKNKKTSVETKNKGLGQLKPLPKTKVDQMSLAGIGNAAAGLAVVEFGKALITPKESKTATKRDLKQLENKLLKRYHEIKNMAPDPYGRKAYFDIREQVLVYLNLNLMQY